MWIHQKINLLKLHSCLVHSLCFLYLFLLVAKCLKFLLEFFDGKLIGGFNFSETPDLGNWFSSYEYESPALTDDFIVAGPRAGERTKEGSVLENTENEEENFSKTKEVNANANVCIDKAKSSDGKHENKHDRFKVCFFSL